MAPGTGRARLRLPVQAAERRPRPGPADQELQRQVRLPGPTPQDRGQPAPYRTALREEPAAVPGRTRRADPHRQRSQPMRHTSGRRLPRLEAIDRPGPPNALQIPQRPPVRRHRHHRIRRNGRHLQPWPILPVRLCRGPAVRDLQQDDPGQGNRQTRLLGEPLARFRQPLRGRPGQLRPRPGRLPRRVPLPSLGSRTVRPGLARRPGQHPGLLHLRRTRQPPPRPVRIRSRQLQAPAQQALHRPPLDHPAHRNPLRSAPGALRLPPLLQDRPGLLGKEHRADAGQRHHALCP
ncbi:hypothetical protein FQZ97_831390 [compost metagenome]